MNEDNEKRKKIEFYIGKLQTLLSKIISESSEFQELKKLTSTEDSDIQFCIFSVMTDKNTAALLKNLDIEQLQKFIVESQGEDNFDDLGDPSWTEDDVQFLKDLKIII